MALVTALGQDRANVLLEELNAFLRQLSGLFRRLPGRGDAHEYCRQDEGPMSERG
jgi:hypothetical protein